MARAVRDVGLWELARMLAEEGMVYVSVRRLARLLGVSTRTAGMILAEMERAGLAVRWSRRTY